MSALSNIPPLAVLPLSAYDLPELKRSSEQFDQSFLHAQFGDCTDKDSVLAEIAKSFSFPDHFGANLDALYDCVTDLDPPMQAERPGFVVILEGLPDTAEFDVAQRNKLLDVFRDAADFFDDNEIAFRVFYSVKRDASKQA